jgi:CHAT domain-containing protein
MYAGAPSVVVSLWAVADESTSTLMDGLYRHLVSDSTDKTDALHQAKVEMIAAGDYSHPFYWAPFVLSGDWR